MPGRQDTNSTEKKVISIRQKIGVATQMPASVESIKSSNFALHGDELNAYQRIQKKSDSGLTDKTPSNVQASIISELIGRIRASHATQSIPIPGLELGSTPASGEVFPRFIYCDLEERVSQQLSSKKIAGSEDQKGYSIRFQDVKRTLVPGKHLIALPFTEPQTASVAEERILTPVDRLKSSLNYPVMKELFEPNSRISKGDMRSYIANRVKKARSEIDNTDVQNDAVPPGPLYPTSAADEIAIHEFSTLQIAWDPIWTNAVASVKGTPSAGRRIATPEVVTRLLPEFRSDPDLWLKTLRYCQENGEDANDFLALANEHQVYQYYHNILQPFGGMMLDNVRYRELPRCAEIAGLDPEAAQHQYETLYEIRKTAMQFFFSIRDDVIKGNQYWAGELELWKDAVDAYGKLQFQSEEEKAKNTWYMLIPNTAFDWRENLIHYISMSALLRAKAREIVADVLASGSEPISTVFPTDTVDMGYSFPVFAPGTTNFGLLVKYHQLWEPGPWQVGDLIKTLPLAPKESRKYRTVTRTNTKRSRREKDRAFESTGSNEAVTSRAQSEIVRRANEKMGFSATAGGGVEVLDIVNLNASTSFNVDSTTDSSDSKRKFREAVTKAAQELKSERQLEVIDEFETEESEDYSREINNPNEEITVTYQFFELERQYRVWENLQSVDSVILIAQAITPSSDIDWEWVLHHDWIIKRAILDESFLSALDIVQQGEDSLDQQVKNSASRLASVQGAFDAAKNKLASMESQAVASSAELKAATDAIHSLSTAEDSMFVDIFEDMFGGDEGQQINAWEQRRQAAVATLETLSQQAIAAKQELKFSRSALDRAIDSHNAAVKEKNIKARKVERLIEHIRQNLLYYQQAIWRYEPDDQRYLRLFNQEVPFFDYPADDAEVRVRIDGNTGAPRAIVLPPPTTPVSRRLDEVADLNNLIGFKGNYLIFPLRKQCYLTAYMAKNYLAPLLSEASQGDNIQGLQVAHDPDNTLRERFIRDITNNEASSKLKDLIESGKVGKDNAPSNIVVPTECVFIEALTGKYPLLENFKLRHRQIDVEKAQEEAYSMSLENIRLEARLLDLDFEDPQIDKLVEVRGKPTSVNVEE